MKFQILLWILSKLMIRANKKNNAFRKEASKKNITFQLNTMDHKVVRHFSFKNGNITTNPLAHPNPDFSINFKDAGYAFSVLLSKNKEAFTNGMACEDIIIEGDFSLLIWFQNLMNLLRNKEIIVPDHLKNVGIIGVGFMGAPMARSLLRGGFSVKVYDKNPEALSKIIADGATECTSLNDMKGVNTIIVMVNNMNQVEEVVLELCQILPENGDIPILIMSTVSPDQIRELRAKLDDMGREKLDILDAPVSGAPLLAEAGKISIMAGGEKKVFNKVKPVFDALGDEEKIFFVGSLGNGAGMKLVNNIVAISVGLNLIEAMNLGQQKGLAPDFIAKIMNASSGKTFITEQWPLSKKMFEMMLNDTTYDAKGALFTTGIKDLETAKKWAETDNIPISCVDNAIDQINNMSEEDVVSQLETFLKK